MHFDAILIIIALGFLVSGIYMVVRGLMETKYFTIILLGIVVACCIFNMSPGQLFTTLEEEYKERPEYTGYKEAEDYIKNLDMQELDFLEYLQNNDDPFYTGEKAVVNRGQR